MAYEPTYAVISHYGDTNKTADSVSKTVGLYSDTHDAIKAKEAVNWGHNVFHAFRITVTITKAYPQFEPIGLVGFFQDIRIDT